MGIGTGRTWSCYKTSLSSGLVNTENSGMQQHVQEVLEKDSISFFLINYPVWGVINGLSQHFPLFSAKSSSKQGVKLDFRSEQGLQRNL